jgi:hypothetical protein
MDDTIDTGPAGEPGSIIPGGLGPGMMPPADAPVDSPAEDDQPLGDRLGRDPSNLGDEVQDRGDIVFPNPAPQENNL